MENDPYRIPDGHKGISVKDLNKISIDGRNQLYWNGDLLKTKKILQLSFFQKVGAFVAAIFGITTPIILFLANYSLIKDNIVKNEELWFLRCILVACELEDSPIKDLSSQP